MKSFRQKATALAALLLMAGSFAQAAVHIRYYNKDSEDYTFEVEMDGMTKKVEFDGSRTSSVTIQGGGEEAKIKTECGWVTIEDDAHITIEDGCIEIE